MPRSQTYSTACSTSSLAKCNEGPNLGVEIGYPSSPPPSSEGGYFSFTAVSKNNERGEQFGGEGTNDEHEHQR